MDTRALALMSVSSEWGISVAARLTHSHLVPSARDNATLWRPLDWRHSTVMNVVDGFLTATLLATAYDLVCSLREDCRGSTREEYWKRISLMIRELLVLYVCSTFTSDSLSDVAFEETLGEAFNNPMLGPDRRSQFHLARSAVSRIGRDWILFQRQGPKVWGPMVSEEELKQMHVAYQPVLRSLLMDGMPYPHMASRDREW